MYDVPVMHEHSTFSCIGDMAIGALGAYFVSIDKYRIKAENFNKWFIYLIYLVFFSIYFFRKEFFFGNHYSRIVERSLVATSILFIILEQNYAKNSLFKMSKFKTIGNLGLITYGLYCLHFIGILITITITKKIHLNETIFNVLVVETIVSLGITISISWLSYNYFEKYFLKLKENFTFITK